MSCEGNVEGEVGEGESRFRELEGFVRPFERRSMKLKSMEKSKLVWLEIKCTEF